MIRNSRKVVHRSHWNNQLVEVIDSGDTRSLYFAGNVLQSSMSLHEPQRLVLSYTRYMLASLLLDDEPERILVIGIGAGSLLRFLHRHFPNASIDGIDFSDTVIDLAQRFFHLPGSPQLRIHCSDGFDFLAARADEFDYDLILVDAFDGLGMSDAIYCSDFFELCLHHLSVSGILSVNLWSGDRLAMEQVADSINVHFESYLELPVPNRGNVICLAGRGEILGSLMEQHHEDVAALQKRFSINFSEILKVCRKHNLGLMQRLSHLFS